MEFRILGPLEVVHEGSPVRVGAAKEWAVLAVLLLHPGEVVSRERLIDELWGDSPPPTAAKAVNVYVSQLRKALAVNGADAIVTRSGGYAIDVAPAALDATRFEEMVADARVRVAAGDVEAAAKLLREALALWRGPALAGIALESFARNEVDRLEELRLGALLDRIDCDIALGRHESLVSELELLITQYPLRERLRAQYMLTLYRCGRQADALEAYHDTRRTLVDELGLEPSPSLQRLENAILNQDPALEAPAGLASVSAPRSGPQLRAAADATPSMATPARRVTGHSRRALTVTLVAVTAGVAMAIWLTARGGGHVKTPARIRIAPNSVVKLDPISGRPVAGISVGDTPVSLAVTRAAVWVVNRRDRTVSRIDRRRGSVRTLGGVTFAYDVAADSHGNVWVSDSRQASVARITAMTQGFPVAPAPPERIRVPVRAGALAVGGGYLWVANAAYSAAGRTIGQRTVSRIDLRDRRFITPVPVGELPVAIAFGYGAAWVAAGYGSDSMSIIRTGSSTPQSLVLPLQADDFAETVAVGAGSVWVVTQEGTIFRIDPETRRIVATIRARTVAKESFGIAVGAGFVWVVDRGDSTLTQVDPRTNHIVRRIRLGSVGVVPCGVAATATAVWVTIASDTDCGSIATR